MKQMVENQTPADRHEFFDLLRERFNRPSQKISVQLERLLSKVAHEAPRAAWEMVGNELGGTEWLRNLQREFGEHIPGQLTFPSDRPSTCIWPTSLASIATIASDANGMLSAERHARRFAQCLANFGAICSGKTVWYFTENPFVRGVFEKGSMGPAYVAAQDTLQASIRDQGIETHELESGEISTRLPSVVNGAVASWEAWRIAASKKFRITYGMWPFDARKWKYFCDLDNPFEPLLSLWATGYRLSIMFTEEEPVIRLYAKPIDVSNSC
jgi:hypothetical protein